MAGPVHYEVFIRKTAPAPWSLHMATEDRAVAVRTAEDMLAGNGAVAVRVTRETLDPDTMLFKSMTVLTRGAPEVQSKRAAPAHDAGPRCTVPQDFYAPQARETIGRVLQDWLARQGVTAFELLHRPDLAEKLEASGVELQHAIQKVAVPESQDPGRSMSWSATTRNCPTRPWNVSSPPGVAICSRASGIARSRTSPTGWPASRSGPSSWPGLFAVP